MIVAALTFTLALVASAAAEVDEVGNPTGNPFPPPDCPKSCSVIARVTGYQDQIGTTHKALILAKPGKVVAFTLDLGAPDAAQVKYFDKTFGGDPQARIAILRPNPHKHSVRLIAESDPIDVAPYLGSTPTFALSTPLVVPGRAVAALTTQTWLPAFATNVASDETWRSFRANCSDNTQPALQLTIGRSATYNCIYKGARLLYSATFVPDPTPTRSGSTKQSHRTRSARAGHRRPAGR